MATNSNYQILQQQVVPNRLPNSVVQGAFTSANSLTAGIFTGSPVSSQSESSSSVVTSILESWQQSPLSEASASPSMSDYHILNVHSAELQGSSLDSEISSLWHKAFSSASSTTRGVFLGCPVGTPAHAQQVFQGQLPGAVSRDWDDMANEQKHFKEPFENLSFMQVGSFPFRLLGYFLQNRGHHPCVQESEKSKLFKLTFEGKDYAVKVYPISSEKRSKTLDSTLRRELHAGTDRHSPYLVRSYFAVKNVFCSDAGDLSSVVVMPFLEGQELFGLISAKNHPYSFPHPVDTRALLNQGLSSVDGQMYVKRIQNLQRLLHDIVDALDALHSKGIIYRDLKPENIIAGHDHVLIDLEFSKDLTPTPSGAAAEDFSPPIPELVRAHSVLGTAEYVAPEVMSSKTSYSFPADIWSLGATLYTVAFGRYILGSSKEGCIQKLQNREPIVYGFAPTQFIYLLKGMLQYQPNVRITLDEIRQHPFYYGDAEGLALDLVEKVAQEVAHRRLSRS